MVLVQSYSYSEVDAYYTPMAASHFLGPSALPPLAKTLPADEAGFASEEGISGFADAADAFLLRLEACTSHQRCVSRQRRTGNVPQAEISLILVSRTRPPCMISPRT